MVTQILSSRCNFFFGPVESTNFWDFLDSGERNCRGMRVKSCVWKIIFGSFPRRRVFWDLVTDQERLGVQLDNLSPVNDSNFRRISLESRRGWEKGISSGKIKSGLRAVRGRSGSCVERENIREWTVNPLFDFRTRTKPRASNSRVNI
jgi:hypothetical protein